MRAVRMRGTYDSSFEDQFTWLRTTDPDYKIVSKVNDCLDTVGDSLVVTVFAEIR